MIRKYLVLVGSFCVTLILLIVNVTMLAVYTNNTAQARRLNADSAVSTNFQLTAAGGTSQMLDATVIAGDARVLLLHQFMSKYQSPLTQYADVMVAEADRNGLDFRLVPAIAMCESNLGIRIPSRDSYNAWGLAVYTGQLSGKKFENWPAAIQWVSSYIKERYYDKGYKDLYAIGAIWAPPSVNNGYSWTNCVEGFMKSIQ
jgi:hypothetical protein